MLHTYAPEALVIERLKVMRKKVKRGSDDWQDLTLAIEFVESCKTVTEEDELFRLWSLPDPRV